MTVIRVQEWAVGTGNINAKLSFADGEEYPITINDPFSEKQEGELEWYFEQHLRFPFIDSVRARDAAHSIDTYGEILFRQVFADPEAYARYKERVEVEPDTLTLEIAGSPSFHRWHWEALKDPQLPEPLALQITIVRRNLTPTMMRTTLHPWPTINLLLVVARPSGNRDVGYRTISRPVVEALRQGGVPVKIDILRPSTYRSLVNHLQKVTDRHGAGYYQVIHLDVHGSLLPYEISHIACRNRYGREDIQPYEGKKAFLALEGEQNNTVDLVEASELASLLMAHQVPIALLNACQSGKQIGTSETSLGSRLMQAGVQLVLAMGYSVTVSAAEILMRTLYTDLSEGHDLPMAIQHGRQELFKQKGRRVYFDQMIDLEDWLLPVVYQNRPLRLQLRPFTPQESREYYQHQANQYQPSEPTYGFVGRDLDILQIEKRLLAQSNLLLIRGMGGAGKTTLLKHIGTWWQTTNFVEQVCYFGYDERIWTCQQLIFAIAQKLFGKEGYARDFEPLSLEAQQQRLVQHLRTSRHLLILDNLESITDTVFAIQHTLPTEEQNALRHLIADLVGGKTLVLLGSRSGEEWLAKGTFGDNVYDLPGLDPEAASALAERILERNGVTKYRQDEKLLDLLKLLDGFPLALEVILANLVWQTPSEVLNALQSGDVTLNVGSSQERTENILRCIDYSYSNLSSQAQQLLLCLAPFTSVINVSLLENYSAFLQHQPLLASLPLERWPEVVREAEHWGLLTKDPRLLDYFHVQPTLPYFLRNRLRDHPQEGLRLAIEIAFREHYDRFAHSLYELLESEDPQKRNLGQLFASLEYENLYTALNLSLANYAFILEPYTALSSYLEGIQDHRRGLELGQAVLKHLETYPPELLAGQTGLDLMTVISTIAKCYLSLSQYTEADAMYRRALALCLQSTGYDTKGIRKVAASLYHELGRLTREQRKWEEAKPYYQQALQIFGEYNDRYQQAGLYHELGIVAEEQRKWEEAEGYFRKALQIHIEYNARKKQATDYHELGRLAEEQRKWEEAKHYFQQALQIFGEYNDRYEQARNYRLLGIVAEEQRKWEEAEGYFRKALQVHIEYNAHNEQANAYYHLGIVAKEQRKWEEAEGYFRKALQICSEYNFHYEQGSIYRELGSLAQEQRKWEEAEDYFQQTLQIDSEYNDLHKQAVIYRELGSLAQEQRKWEEAEGYFQQALQINSEYNDLHEQAVIYLKLGRLAHAQRKWKEAKEYFLQALEMFIDDEGDDADAIAVVLRNLAVLWRDSGDRSITTTIARILKKPRDKLEKDFLEFLHKFQL